jgi:23S rRNA (guanine745-N1)-methyltransferase
MRRLHGEILAALRCPVCRGPLAAAGPALRCAAGHGFDLARQGYVNLLVGRAASGGDTAAMVAARAAVLDAGHFAPLEAALARVAVARAAAAGLVVEIGAGTARYAKVVLDALPGRFGIALDVSKAAARRAARAHQRLGAAVADAKATWPLADRAAALVLGVFAPRHGAEAARVLAEGGALLVVIPGAEHLAELRAAFGLLMVDPDKERRVAEALEPWLAREQVEEVRWEMRLDRAAAAAVAGMGPSAFHLDAAQVEMRAAALGEAVGVRGDVRIEVWRRRGSRPVPPSSASSGG